MASAVEFEVGSGSASCSAFLNNVPADGTAYTDASGLVTRGGSASTFEQADFEATEAFLREHDWSSVIAQVDPFGDVTTESRDGGVAMAGPVRPVVSRAHRGDADTLALDERAARAMDENAADLLRYLLRRVDRQDAPDVLSVVFTTAWRRRADLPPDRTQARMWLYGVARRCAPNHRRRPRVHGPDPLRPCEAAPRRHARAEPTERAHAQRPVRGAVTACRYPVTARIIWRARDGRPE